MKAMTNTENVREFNGKFSLAVEQEQASGSSTDLVRHNKNTPQNCKWITYFKFLIQINKIILSLNVD